MPTRTGTALWALLGLACAPTVVPPPPARDSGPRDASACPECPDTGPIVIRRDAGRDTGPLPDANVDAFFADAGELTDGGAPVAITVDGFLDEAVWIDPLTADNVPSDAFAGDHLDSLFYFRDASWLYIGFTGELVPGDAVVFYVDTRLDEGVSLLGFGLFDTTGPIDATLSLPMNGTVDFAPELGWGTAAMPQAASSGSDTIGWRLLSATGGFPLISTGSRSACSAMGCETVMSLDTLGATADSAIRFIVRLGRPGADGGWSNQTFPATDSASPEFVDFPIGVPAFVP